MLDNKFEKYRKKHEFDFDDDFDEESGNLDENSELVIKMMKDHDEAAETVPMKDFIEKCTDKERVLNYQYEKSSDEEMIEIETEIPNRDWDCETIITNSCTVKSYTPSIISIPSKKPRSVKLTPEDVSSDSKNRNEKTIKTKTQNILSTQVIIIPREKDETLEEKKARKQQIKESRRTRREEKAVRKKNVKQEICRQSRNRINIVQSECGQRID